VNLTTYLVPVKIGTEGSAALLIELNSGEQIKLVEKPKYLAQAEQLGYFVYNGFKFYSARRVIALEGREFTSTNTNFMRAYNYIELRAKNYGLLDKVKRELSW
jgi:hypothetical protein